MKSICGFLAAAGFALLCCSEDGVAPDIDTGPVTEDGAPGKDMGKPAPDKGEPVADQGRPLPDKGSADGQATLSEKEPNDGSTPSEFQYVQWPVVIKGALGKAGDIDAFGINAKAGDRLVANVKVAAVMQPHLVINPLLDIRPFAANAGAKEIFAEYYNLADGPLFIVVRDRRNVSKPSQNVGGPAFTYTLSIQRLKRAVVPLSISVEKPGSLAPRGTVRVFSYTASKGLDIGLTVKAKQLASPSDVDSRLSLFHPGQKVWVGTNDDAKASLSDSLLKGPMPLAGTYHAIVENVKIDAADLRFSIRATTIK